MKLPKAKNLDAEKYDAGLSLFKQKFAKIKLSANESALGASPRAIKEYMKVSKDFKRYPDSDGTFLRKTIAKKFKLNQSRIILGNGSDQIFETLMYSLTAFGLGPNADSFADNFILANFFLNKLNPATYFSALRILAFGNFIIYLSLI